MSTEATPLIENVESFLSEPRPLLIDGQWKTARSGATFSTLDPATGEVFATVADGGKPEIDAAVASARRAFDGGWAQSAGAYRADLLNRLADLIETHAEEFAQLDSLDCGKPISLARLADVPTAIGHFRYFSGWATKLSGETIPVSAPGFLNYTVREPIGVVGLIIPWNFPVMFAAVKLAPALCSGCTVVLKPAEQTPLSALRLGELIQEAGFPDGVVNIVPGSGEIAGAALAAHPGVDKIAFTGSTEVGRKIIAAAAGNLKKVSLELGGKAPNIILPDADLDTVADAAADAIFFNQGEACCAGTRLLVHESCRRELVEEVIKRAAAIKVGPGLLPDTQMGPLVSEEQLARVQGYLESGLSQGARIVTGGGRPAGLEGGYFLEPTVFEDVEASMAIAQEEIFGPVLTVLGWSDLDDLVRKANDTVYGLAAGIWTKDLSRAHNLAARMKAGTVWINCWNAFDPGSPWGGYRQSGWGRETGRLGAEQYTEVKSVWVNLN
ncbi:MAG: aldehyde dehydrogenase family protein [bacterium]|nr:betaine-aldehyde dehydrogenase [Deltaproteobacteria bacterium]MCP4908816.1 aldehyde dehydrogenase family protein [bacterium]